MKTQKLLFIFLSMIHFLLFVSCSPTSPSAVALVKGTEVTQDDLRLHLFLFQDNIEESLFLNDSVIPHYILAIAAKDFNGAVTVNDVDQALDQYFIVTGRAKDSFFYDAKRKGFDLISIRRVFHERIMISWHLETVLPEVIILEEELRSYYEEKKIFFDEQGISEFNGAKTLVRSELLALKREELYGKYVDELAISADIIVY